LSLPKVCSSSSLRLLEPPALEISSVMPEAGIYAAVNLLPQ